MGRIAEVLEFIRETVGTQEIAEVKGDPGGGAAFTAQHFDGTGVDAQPLPGDIMATGDSPGANAEHVTGYADPKNRGKASAGERRLYCRDQNGDEVGELWLKNDGTLAIEMTVSASIKAPTVILDSPDVRISDTAGADLMRVGDLVAVTVPPMLAGIVPVTPVLPIHASPTGGILAAGQGISGNPKAKG